MRGESRLTSMDKSLESLELVLSGRAAEFLSDFAFTAGSPNCEKPRIITRIAIKIIAALIYHNHFVTLLNDPGVSQAGLLKSHFDLNSYMAIV